MESERIRACIQQPDILEVKSPANAEKRDKVREGAGLPVIIISIFASPPPGNYYYFFRPATKKRLMMPAGGEGGPKIVKACRAPSIISSCAS